MNLPWLIIAILGTVSLMFTIISLATAAWIVVGSSGDGLWQSCFDSACFSVPSFAVGASLRVTRIFMILSLGKTLAATLFAFYGAIKEEAVKTSSKVGGNFIAIFLLVLMSVFTGKCNAASDFWGYSFGLGWTSTCFSIVFAVASFILKMQEK